MSIVTPTHVDERSIFSFTPPMRNPPSAEEVVANKLDWKMMNITNVVDCPRELHFTLPDGIEIQKHLGADGQSNYGLYATKLLKKHTIIYRSKGYHVHMKDVDFKIINDLDGTEYQLNAIRHLSKVADGIGLILTFQSFTDHSCDPSCYFIGREKNVESDVITLRDIHSNEQITCDYCLFEYDPEGK